MTDSAKEFLSDRELLLQAQSEDKVALEILIARYFQHVYHFSLRYLRNQQDAEDVTQEVFVKIWRNLKKFDSGRAFKPWILEIAKNTCLDWLKKKRAIPFSVFENEAGENPLVELLSEDTPPPSEALDQSFLDGRLDLAVRQLSPRYQEVFALRYQENLSFREIAVTIKQPLNTVKSRYRRALIRLRKLLGRS